MTSGGLDLGLQLQKKNDLSWKHYNFNCINQKEELLEVSQIVINTDRLMGTCCYSEYVKKYVAAYGRGGFIFFGPPNAQKCFEDVKEIVDNCGSHFTNHICPKFEFPKRPYNVTFTVFNEFAIYAQLAGFKNGDSKSHWDNRRKQICEYNDIRDLYKKFPAKNN
ncbi:hypothetical protein J437_LFUL003199, partial [Ladona fulva]